MDISAPDLASTQDQPQDRQPIQPPPPASSPVPTPDDPPMQVDTPAATTPPIEKTEFTFDYVLRNWARIEEQKVYSPWYDFAGYSWRLLIFPAGNQAEADISVYLECGGPGERARVPPQQSAATAAAAAAAAAAPMATNVPAVEGFQRPTSKGTTTEDTNADPSVPANVDTRTAKDDTNANENVPSDKLISADATNKDHPSSLPNATKITTAKPTNTARVKEFDDSRLLDFDDPPKPTNTARVKEFDDSGLYDFDDPKSRQPPALDATQNTTTQLQPAKDPARDQQLPGLITNNMSEKSKEPAPVVMPAVWRRPAHFWLTLKPTGRTVPGATGVTKEAPHTFVEKDSDWGFREFARISMLQRDRYEDDNGSLHIGVRIKLVEASTNSMFTSGTWDSRKITGYVGFKNQGATCYMNSLLQTLYMLGSFRRAVYEMPLPNSEDDDSVGGSRMSYALQKVFYELETSSTTVKTKKLTESFGWESSDAFTQHDVQELNRILCDHLEERMKKIAPDEPNKISGLFEGKILNYIECVNVDYKSTREESFYDLSLNVKGCRNIYDSFDKYCEVETMDGDNKYRAEGYEELQEAKKGVRFLRLPPVLQLHLKRFEYDFQREAMVKINDRFEYATEIDLSSYVDNSDGSDVYVLHSVLVHIGDVNGGHYFAYIRPNAKTPEPREQESTAAPGSMPQSTWFKFDDDMVSGATEENAVADNFGSGGEREPVMLNTRVPDDLLNESTNGDLNGAQTPPPTVHNQSRVRSYAARRLSNAYMLQYVRKDMAETLLMPTKEGDVPKLLSSRIVSEQQEEERLKRERAEQHLYMTVVVATDRDMAEHNGVDVIAWENVRHIRVKRAMLLRELKSMLWKQKLASSFQEMRLWKCVMRRNNSTRPDSLLANGVDENPIAEPSRDYASLQTATYNAGYQPRYGMHTEDVLKLYIEDFQSPYNFCAGQQYMGVLRKVHQVREEIRKRGGGLQEQQVAVDKLIPENGFKLIGGEILIFFKRYIPSPPRLEWIGHMIVDRQAKVQTIIPKLTDAILRKASHTADTIPLKGGSVLLYEEFCAQNTPHLLPGTTFEANDIPIVHGRGGDIIVFMEKENESAEAPPSSPGDMVIDGHDAEFELQKSYDFNLPLGGRPIPTPPAYYKYLQHQVKIEFKNKYNADGTGGIGETKGIVLELLTTDTYRDTRAVLATAIGRGAVAGHMRFFSHDFHRDAPQLDAWRYGDTEELRRMWPSHSMAAMSPGDHRILWYEQTEYPISEYEDKEEVRLTWRPDGGARSTPIETQPGSPETSPSASEGTNRTADLNSVMTDVTTPDVTTAPAPSPCSPQSGAARTFSILLPIGCKYEDVMNEVREKMGLEEAVPIRVCEVRNYRITRILEPRELVSRTMAPIATFDQGTELRAEPLVDCEAADGVAPSDTVPIYVAHLTKDSKSRSWTRPSYFGVPIVLRVNREGETVGAIRQRIRARLNVPENVFVTWKLASAQVSATGTREYLEDMDQYWLPEAGGHSELAGLAIEHHGSAPARKTTSASLRLAEAHKPLKIKS